MRKKNEKPYKKGYLEITNVCNLTCDFCPKTIRAPRFMSLEEFTHLIQQVKPMTDYVYFHLMGEPLLHPLLGEFLKICHQMGLHVSITTNGTLLSACRTVLEGEPHLYKVSISLHSFAANSATGSLESYVEDVLDFVRDRASTDTICVLRLWNRDSAVLKATNQRNVDLFALLEQFYPAAGNLFEQLEQDSSVKLAPRVFLEVAEKFSWPDLSDSNQQESAFCHGLRDQFGVLCDGTVVPCCLDNNGTISLGNVFEQPLREILSCARATKIYEGFSNRKPTEPLCTHCAGKPQSRTHNGT